MINIWKQGVNGIEKADSFLETCWIDVIAPTNSEIDIVTSRFNISHDDVIAVLDIDEQSRIERDEDLLIIIYRVPVHDINNEVPFFTIPFGIFIKGNTIVTVSLLENEILKDIYSKKIKNFIITNANTFMLRFFFRSAIYYLRYLKDINRQTYAAEKDLQKSIKNKELIHLLMFEKSLVYFTTSLKQNELFIEKLERITFIQLDEEHKEMLTDLLIENKQAIEMANIYSNILSGMMDAFASVISNNLNVVMKQLTSISIIVMIPTLIASIYGMNIFLPFQHNKFAFLIIMGIAGVIAAIGILIFRKRKFF